MIAAAVLLMTGMVADPGLNAPSSTFDGDIPAVDGTVKFEKLSGDGLVIVDGPPPRSADDLCGWCQDDIFNQVIHHRMDAEGVIVSFCAESEDPCDENGHDWLAGRCSSHYGCGQTDDAELLLASIRNAGNARVALLRTEVARGNRVVRVSQDRQAFEIVGCANTILARIPYASE